MPTITLFDLLLMAGLWLWALWGWRMRTARTLALLVGATVLYVLVGMVGGISAVFARAAVLAVAVGVLMSATAYFSNLPREAFRLDEAYRQLLNNVREAVERKQSGRTNVTDMLETLNQIADRMALLAAPDAAHTQLRDHSVAHLRKQIQRPRLSHEAPGGKDAGAQELARIVEEQDRLWSSCR